VIESLMTFEECRKLRESHPATKDRANALPHLAKGALFMQAITASLLAAFLHLLNTRIQRLGVKISKAQRPPAAANVIKPLKMLSLWRNRVADKLHSDVPK